MQKLFPILLGLLCIGGSVFSQCGTTNVVGNFSPANGDTLTGIYNVSGDFIVAAGVTVYVRPWGMNGCGRLEVNAAGNIDIQGTINANGAGIAGGTGGASGASNNAVFIEQCSSPTDQCGDIFTFGGGAGIVGGGPGGGLAGIVGNGGSGRKNRCLNFGDEGGRAGGAGGGGAGGGGSYGGQGTIGGNGGGGSLPTMSTSDVGCTSNPIVSGTGGIGGGVAATVGTINGTDITLGTGGAGAGGGGRGRFPGNPGADGGAGGGEVKLVAAVNVTISGTISANGGNGGAGGTGGGSGASLRCCTDACPGVDEYTHTGSGGSGGGAGGGSGGGIFVEAGALANITGSFSARGGNGGAGAVAANGYTMTQNCLLGNSSASAPAGGAGQLGGAGGGGRIKFFTNPCIAGNTVTPVTNVTGGAGNAGSGNTGSVATNPHSQLVEGAALPATQAICYNGDPGALSSLTATGGTGTYTYQWQSQTNCTGAWTNIPAANALSYDPPAGLQATTCYRLEIVSGTCTIYSDTLTVNVGANLPATVNPAGPIVGCTGDSTLLTTSGGVGATYQWYFNGTPILMATDSFYHANASGNFMVEIIYLGGCNAFSNPIVATFSASPPAFSVALQDTIVCPGDSTELLGIGGGTYQWLLNGSPIVGATNANYQAMQAGNYTVEVTIPGGCSAASAPIILTAGSAPAAGLAAAGATQFCAGDSVLLNASGGQTYSWLLNGQAFPNGSGGSIQAQSGGDYQVIAFSSDGCRDTSANVNVIVDPSPVALLSSVGNPITCVGDTVLFFASGGTTFEWLFNGVAVGNTNSFLAAGTQGDYSVVVTNASGCSDTSSVFAFSFYPPVAVTVTSLGGSFICNGDSLALQANGPGAISWLWYRNDTLIPGANNATYEATMPGAFTAVAIDQYGCEYPSAFQMVYPGESPHASLAIMGQASICGSDSIPLIATGGNIYEWFLNGQTIAGASDSILWVNQAGDYQVAAASGCGTDTSAILQVNPSNGPIAGFEYENHPLSEVQFRDMSISGAQWLWNFGDGMGTSVLQNPLHQFPNPGTYQVTMITWDAQGCSDTMSLAVIVTDPDFFIPNVFSPNADGINDVAQTNFQKLSQFEFTIYDRWGSLVFFTQTQDDWWDGKVGGNLAPDGVYFYYLNGQFFNEKEVRQKGNISLLR